MGDYLMEGRTSVKTHCIFPRNKSDEGVAGKTSDRLASFLLEKNKIQDLTDYLPACHLRLTHDFALS